MITRPKEKLLAKVWRAFRENPFDLFVYLFVRVGLLFVVFLLFSLIVVS